MLPVHVDSRPRSVYNTRREDLAEIHLHNIANPINYNSEKFLYHF